MEANITPLNCQILYKKRGPNLSLPPVCELDQNRVDCTKPGVWVMARGEPLTPAALWAGRGRRPDFWPVCDSTWLTRTDAAGVPVTLGVCSVLSFRVNIHRLRSRAGAPSKPRGKHGWTFLLRCCPESELCPPPRPSILHAETWQLMLEWCTLCLNIKSRA